MSTYLRTNDSILVNARDFSPTSALFHNKAPFWEAEVTAALSLRKLNVSEFVESIKAVTQKCPDYHVRALDFTTSVDRKAGTAEMFVNVETTGRWPGVATRNVTTCEYQLLEDGVWYHVSHRSMPGMGGAVPGVEG